MAGLLDVFNSDEGMQALGLLAAAAPSMQPMNFAGRLAQAGQAYRGMKDSDADRLLKSQYIQSQIAENTSQAELRKAQIAKQQQILGMVDGLFGAGGVGGAQVSPGAFAPAADGYGPTMPASMSALSKPGSRLASLGIDQVAGLHAAGGPDLLNAYKLAREGFERKPGSFYEGIDGGREYVPDPSKGITFQNGRVGLLPGFTDATTATTLATEVPKALLSSAGKINLRDNPDGTKSPVSELTENPTLLALLGQITRPAGTQGAPRPMGPRPMAAPRSADADMQAIYGAEYKKAQTQLQNAKTPEEAQRAQTDIASLEREMKANGIGYGMTTDQATAAEVKKTKAVEQVKADTQSTAARQNAIASANYLDSVLNMAIEHPGLKTATGLSGTLDPRNYVPGTNAKNFHAVLDQVKGAGFLQAFETLKGGGQITEAEGTKATNAIARLNTAQSSDEFKKALGELQTVVRNGRTRAKNNMKASTGAEGSFAGDNSDIGQTSEPSKNMLAELPKTAPKGQRVRDTATGKVLRFDGMRWVEEK